MLIYKNIRIGDTFKIGSRVMNIISETEYRYSGENKIHKYGGGFFRFMEKSGYRQLKRRLIKRSGLIKLI